MTDVVHVFDPVFILFCPFLWDRLPKGKIFFERYRTIHFGTKFIKCIFLTIFKYQSLCYSYVAPEGLNCGVFQISSTFVPIYLFFCRLQIWPILEFFVVIFKSNLFQTMVKCEDIDHIQSSFFIYTLTWNFLFSLAPLRFPDKVDEHVFNIVYCMFM